MRLPVIVAVMKLEMRAWALQILQNCNMVLQGLNFIGMFNKDTVIQLISSWLHLVNGFH